MSTRPPPPATAAGRPGFVGRVWRRNLRPVVITGGILSGIWTLVWGVSAFQNISLDRSTNLGAYATFDIVLGALYLATMAIEIFGVVAALLQRISFARIYSVLSLIAAVIIFAAEILNIVLDFKFKRALLDECVQAFTNPSAPGRGWWGRVRYVLSPREADATCSNLWNRAVFADFAWLIVTTILSLMFSAIAYAYYRQLLDPASTAYPRAPSNQIQLENYTPYDGPSNQFARPPGPPPGQGEDYVPPYEGHKLPGYGAEFAPREPGPEKGDHEHDGPSTNPFEDPRSQRPVPGY